MIVPRFLRLKIVRLKVNSTRKSHHLPQQRGYMLITLMLGVALVTIGLLVVLPQITRQIQRDREEELAHRGTAYMRAIQRYYRRLGRYPSSIDDLENTNNVRYLRKRYKDPMNRDAAAKEKDFKLLHQSDIALNNGPSLQGLSGTAGQSGVGPHAGLASAAAPQKSVGQQTAEGDGNPSDGSENSNASTEIADSTTDSSASSPLSGPTFGGSPILGVARTSKAKTIREFYGKNHYNDWLFIYVQGIERGGGLLTGPVKPSLPTANLDGLAAGQPDPN
jgi:type II secretory pathway pseudopilin PulG